MDALSLAKLFHEIYERRAPEFGYETRKETKEFDPETPNGKLMIAVCGEIIKNMNAGDFWSNIVYPEGATPEQIQAELTDYITILNEVSIVYDHVTGGRISKPNTLSGAVIGEFEDLWEMKGDNDDTYTDENGVVFCSHCDTAIDAAETEDKK